MNLEHKLRIFEKVILNTTWEDCKSNRNLCTKDFTCTKLPPKTYQIFTSWKIHRNMQIKQPWFKSQLKKEANKKKTIWDYFYFIAHRLWNLDSRIIKFLILEQLICFLVSFATLFFYVCCDCCLYSFRFNK